MGVSIDARVYNIEEMKSAFEKVYDEYEAEYEKDGKIRPSEFLDIVMPKFGEIVDGKFIIVWNDYADEFNPAINFIVALDNYYGEDRMNTWKLKRTTSIDGGAEPMTSYEAEEWGIPNWVDPDGEYDEDY